MTPRRVQFTETARVHVRAAITWWRENRLNTNILADEIEESVSLVSRLPGVGAKYDRSNVEGVRRLYLRRASYHVYYTYDAETVTIRGLWHARRDGAPPLEP